MGAPEAFDKDTLSEKIDGKAELYLGAGFVSMTCQRFALAADPKVWLEMFVYDMGAPLNAFAVFSQQRRPGSAESDVAQFAYGGGGSLFFVHGRHYLEIVASQASPAMEKAAAQTAREFVAKNPDAKGDMSAFALLPVEGLVRQSVSLVLNDAFGFDQFDNVITASYLMSGTTTTAFLSVRKSPEEAAALATAYHQFLTVTAGADTRVSTATIATLRGANALGDAELVFSEGAVVAGVHAAKTREAAEALAARRTRRSGRAGNDRPRP